jgi:hypothetical protein
LLQEVIEHMVLLPAGLLDYHTPHLALSFANIFLPLADDIQPPGLPVGANSNDPFA